MVLLKDFAKDKEFGGDAVSFPQGETIIDAEQIQVEEKTVELQGEPKQRWLLKTSDKTYWAGVKVMDGVKKALEKGATKMKVIRQGEGVKTSYVVLPILD